MPAHAQIKALIHFHSLKRLASQFSSAFASILIYQTEMDAWYFKEIIDLMQYLPCIKFLLFVTKPLFLLNFRLSEQTINMHKTKFQEKKH